MRFFRKLYVVTEVCKKHGLITTEKFKSYFSALKALRKIVNKYIAHTLKGSDHFSRLEFNAFITKGDHVLEKAIAR